MSVLLPRSLHCGASSRIAEMNRRRRKQRGALTEVQTYPPPQLREEELAFFFSLIGPLGRLLLRSATGKKKAKVRERRMRNQRLNDGIAEAFVGAVGDPTRH